MKHRVQRATVFFIFNRFSADCLPRRPRLLERPAAVAQIEGMEPAKEDRDMNSSIIGKIEKAHRYAREPERVRLRNLEASFRGGHDDYTVRLIDGRWDCSCHTFSSHAVGTCSHVMAMQQLLGPMLSDDARYDREIELAASAATA
jgi:hypothetical protein